MYKTVFREAPQVLAPEVQGHGHKREQHHETHVGHEWIHIAVLQDPGCDECGEPVPLRSSEGRSCKEDETAGQPRGSCSR
jgi:hypothetical protein